MTEIELRIRIVKSLADVPAADWNACAAGDTGSPQLSTEQSTRGYPDNPFRIARISILS